MFFLPLSFSYIPVSYVSIYLGTSYTHMYIHIQGVTKFAKSPIWGTPFEVLVCVLRWDFLLDKSIIWFVSKCLSLVSSLLLRNVKHKIDSVLWIYSLRFLVNRKEKKIVGTYVWKLDFFVLFFIIIIFFFFLFLQSRFFKARKNLNTRYNSTYLFHRSTYRG